LTITAFALVNALYYKHCIDQLSALNIEF